MVVALGALDLHAEEDARGRARQILRRVAEAEQPVDRAVDGRVAVDRPRDVLGAVDCNVQAYSLAGYQALSGPTSPLPAAMAVAAGDAPTEMIAKATFIDKANVGSWVTPLDRKVTFAALNYTTVN